MAHTPIRDSVEALDLEDRPDDAADAIARWFEREVPGMPPHPDVIDYLAGRVGRAAYEHQVVPTYRRAEEMVASLERSMT